MSVYDMVYQAAMSAAHECVANNQPLSLGALSITREEFQEMKRDRRMLQHMNFAVQSLEFEMCGIKVKVVGR